MEIFLDLLILLILARLFGELLLRLGLPQIVWEVCAGVALALAAASAGQYLPPLESFKESPAIGLVAEFGIFFLILSVGIEMQPREIMRRSRVSLLVAVGGMVLPLLSGAALGWAVLPDTPARAAQAMFLGIALSISAVPVAARIFQEAGLLHHRVGRTVLSAAIFDDILGLILLAVLTAVIQTGGLPPAGTFATLLIKVVVFFAITLFAGARLYPWVSRLLGSARSRSAGFSVLVATGFAFGVLADAMGMHFILGAFVAGLYFEKKRVGRRAYREIKATVNSLTDGLVGPIFFASIGLQLDLTAVVTVPGFLAALIALAFAGKLIGAGVPAYFGGLKRRESVAIGVGLSGRGAVEIVIASIALQSGLFTQVGPPDVYVASLFSALVLTAIITTAVAPILLRYIMPPLVPPSGGKKSPLSPL